MHTILFYVKFPEAGKVKTRLAKSIGAEKAAAVYRMVAEANVLALHELVNHGFKVTVMFDPPERKADVARWLGHHFSYEAQVGDDLGARLEYGFQHAFNAGAGKALALGSDTLGLEPAVIEDGFKQMDHHDVVLGPAADGGYYLIGMKQENKNLFKEIPWSTSSVLDSTISQIRKAGQRYHLLETLEDLDEVSNLNRKELV